MDEADAAVEMLFLADHFGQAIEEIPWDPAKGLPDYYIKNIGSQRYIFKKVMVKSDWAGYRQVNREED